MSWINNVTARLAYKLLRSVRLLNDLVQMRPEIKRSFDDPWDGQDQVALNEPFGAGRDAWRLFFDFGIMLSCFRKGNENRRVLDLACGTGWISEWLARMGLDVSALDVDAKAEKILSLRLQADRRIQNASCKFETGDAHVLPYPGSYFGHVCCFDSLHHMHDYRRVLSEIFRVLEKGGRAIFVEPGAKHSSSAETIAFLEKYKKDLPPTWIERDVVLDEILELSNEIGFSSLRLRPIVWPTLFDWSIDDLKSFESSSSRIADGNFRDRHCEVVSDFTRNSRIVFVLEK